MSPYPLRELPPIPSHRSTVQPCLYFVHETPPADDLPQLLVGILPGIYSQRIHLVYEDTPGRVFNPIRTCGQKHTILTFESFQRFAVDPVFDGISRRTEFPLFCPGSCTTPSTDVYDVWVSPRSSTPSLSSYHSILSSFSVFRTLGKNHPFSGGLCSGCVG